MVINPCAKYGKPISNHKKVMGRTRIRTDRQTDRQTGIRTDRVIPLYPHWTSFAGGIKMRYTIQFSILMFCAKYLEAGLCGSREKCDRNFLRRRRRRKTTDSDPTMSPPQKRAGNTINIPGARFGVNDILFDFGRLSPSLGHHDYLLSVCLINAQE